LILYNEQLQNEQVPDLELGGLKVTPVNPPRYMNV